MKRRYSNDKLVVLWGSDKCIQAGKCYGQLPQVFDPARRPWVDVNAADVETIKRVVDDCPTGALSYEIPGAKELGAVTIRALKASPYKISGKCCLINEDGQTVATGNVFALCRCGASNNMPFCDGSHIRIGFGTKK